MTSQKACDPSTSEPNKDQKAPSSGGAGYGVDEAETAREIEGWDKTTHADEGDLDNDTNGNDAISVEYPSSDDEAVLGEVETSDSTEQGALPPGASVSPRLIFVSYRIDPDAPLAEALATLIKDSLEPPPPVYVSGAGGLTPSSHPFRAQLTRAMQESVAVVAVISDHSRTREWILYEAGAAWGRQITYAPVLFGVQPKDLPDTIGDYYACHATTKLQVQRLVEELGKACGAHLKSHFGNRYARFHRVVESHGKARDRPTGNAEFEDFWDAIHTWQDGDKEKGVQKLLNAEAKTDNSESKAHLRFLWIALTNESQNARREQALGLGSPYTGTAWYHIMLGDFDAVPLMSCRAYTKALEVSTPNTNASRQALQRLIKTLCSIGRLEEARGLLVDGLVNSDCQLREALAESFPDYFPDESPLSKLLVLLLCLSSPSANGLEKTASEALDCNFPGLAIHLSLMSLEIGSSGSAYNTLGRAYETAELFSLSYLNYEKAMAEGVSVGRINMASLLRTRAIPGAGLAILTSHEGEFDSKSPSYPFQERSEIENALALEKIASSTYERAGKAFCASLLEFALEAIASPTHQVKVSPATKSRVTPNGTSTLALPITSVETDYMLTFNGNKFDLEMCPIGIFPNAWTGSIPNGGLHGVYRLNPEGVLVGWRLSDEPNARPTSSVVTKKSALPPVDASLESSQNSGTKA